jgi:linearmycin/streptolysin S transport system permease protein
MIGTLLRIGWINLKRDRAAQALTFLLPIVFFSIFALVFGNQRSPTQKVQVAIVDEDQSGYSQKLVAAVQGEGGLSVRTTAEADGKGARLDHAAAEGLVRAGTLPVAVILPKGLGASRGMAGQASPGPAVRILADIADPVAPQMVAGLLQKAAFTAAPDAMARDGLAMFERYAGPLTPAQQRATDHWLTQLDQGGAKTGVPASALGLPIETVDVMQSSHENGSLVSFYAAGIGVMFLLFSSAGGGGTLLDEQDAGTLGRLIGSRAGMGGVLAGKWLFLTLIGCLQLAVMFLWGAAVFRLPLFSHLPGFLVMTGLTAAAAAGFGLVLATLSRTRHQLSGLSTILILSMSAVGGSMFPRFLMSATMQKIGLVTFNAWALDGYLKVFWRGAPLVDLWPQAAVLATLAAVFLVLARLLARRWETL